MCSFLLEIGSFDCVPYGTSLRMTSLGDEGIRDAAWKAASPFRETP